MSSTLVTKGIKNPLLSEHIKTLHTANEQPEERRYEAMEYAFMDIMGIYSHEFLSSKDTISLTNRIFVRQVRDFKDMLNKFPLFTADNGIKVPVISTNSYESLSCVLMIIDKQNEEAAGKSTAVIVDGKKKELDPVKMMTGADYDIDEDLGWDLFDTMKELGLMSVVEDQEEPKVSLQSDVYLGTEAQPKSILLDYSGTYTPNMTIGGLF